MEEKNLGEQLSSVVNESKDGAKEQIDSMAQNLTEISSPVNKFKSLEELSKAYTNLEREFTKKCQAYKTLEQSVKGDNAKVESTVDEQEKVDVAPQYTIRDWEQKIDDFFEKNPTAKQFESEISSVIKQDESLAKKENALEEAFNKVKLNNFKTKTELLSDDDFVENYVLKDEKIKEKIIEDYLSHIMSNNVAPIMNTKQGVNMMITPKSKPKSLKDAKEFAMGLMSGK